MIVSLIFVRKDIAIKKNLKMLQNCSDFKEEMFENLSSSKDREDSNLVFVSLHHN